ncbi:MAG: hypothetical protein Q9187_005521 [Circinaria calcarea]
MSKGTGLDTPRSSSVLSSIDSDNLQGNSKLTKCDPSAPRSPKLTGSPPEHILTVLALFRAHRKGTWNNPWKIRLVPIASSLTVRMPTSIHDVSTELVVEEINSQLRLVSMKQDDLAAVIDLVGSETTSDVYLYEHGAIKQRFPKRSPDGSLVHAKSQYPSIIIETSYSQGQKDVARLADDYICRSNRNIAVVLGFDIESSSGSQRATLSVWRPRLGLDLEAMEKEATFLKAFCVQDTK